MHTRSTVAGRTNVVRTIAACIHSHGATEKALRREMGRKWSIRTFRDGPGGGEDIDRQRQLDRQTDRQIIFNSTSVPKIVTYVVVVTQFFLSPLGHMFQN